MTTLSRLVLVMTLLFASTLRADTQASVERAEPKMVKIYGAGGVRGLEAYQSGFIISGEGHVLTAWSYVLDTDGVIVTMHDGSRHEATLVGADPRIEIAVLKIEATPSEFYDLRSAKELEAGDRVLAFSNLYGIATGDEATSVLHGTVSAVTKLSARRGVFKTPYKGSVYIIDAVTNNSGAAGGALTDRNGEIAGILGKELRSSETNAWLNYAIPVSELQESVQALLEGRSVSAKDEEVTVAQDPWTLTEIGLNLVPNVMSITPPYVESIVDGSLASEAGLLPDDLIMYVGSTLVRSRTDFEKQISQIERSEPLSIAILRDQQLETFDLVPSQE